MLQMSPVGDDFLSFLGSHPEVFAGNRPLGMNIPTYTGGDPKGQATVNRMFDPITSQKPAGLLQQIGGIGEPGFPNLSTPPAWMKRLLVEEEDPSAWMTYAGVGSAENRRYMSYPLASRDKETGQLVRFPDYHQALNHAMGSGEYIPFQTAGAADWFSKNYRKIWGEK